MSAALYDPDWRWVQGLCLSLLAHSDEDVRANAITSLGHIARIHRQLDLDLVLPRLTGLMTDPALAPRVEDALDDIRFYLSSA